jgi:hypothetical protein
MHLCAKIITTKQKSTKTTPVFPHSFGKNKAKKENQPKPERKKEERDYLASVCVAFSFLRCDKVGQHVESRSISVTAMVTGRPFGGGSSEQLQSYRSKPSTCSGGSKCTRAGKKSNYDSLESSYHYHDAVCIDVCDCRHWSW